MTTTTTTPPITGDPRGPGAQGQARGHVGQRQLPDRGRRGRRPLGGILVETVDVQPGQRVLDVAAGTGTSALPAARRGAEVIATDLTPELLDVGRAAAAAEGAFDADLADGRRRGAALRRRRVRRGALGHRRDVRPAPPAGRRRARPGLPARRHHRGAELDPGGLHRAAVRHHEAVRAAASAREPRRPRCGDGPITFATCSGTG